MAGLNDILNIARGALITQQRALNVTGNNIANADTPGYTRQTLNLMPEIPQNTALGTIGRGVTDSGVVSERDVFLDASFRNEQGSYSRSNTLQGLLDQLQAVTAQDQNSGLSSSLDQLWGAFSDLANNPTTGASKVAVQADATGVIQQLHTMAAGIQSVVSSATDQFNSQVGQINTIANQVAELNKEIVAHGGPNHSAPDLEDQRGQLLDQLSSIVDVQVQNHEDGSVSVIAGGTLLVDHAVAQQLDTRATAGGGVAVGLVGNPANLTISSGSLAGLNDLLNTAAPQLQDQLDQFTSALVTSVNAIHSTGPSGIDFFDPAGTTAATIALSTQVAASASNIETGTTTASGDNTIALQLSQLRNVGNASLGGSTLDEFFQGVVIDVGTQTANAEQAASAAQTVSSAIDSQRQSETGVSTDEELINMMKQQQAYSAAAHLVTVANEMMQSLIDMV